MPLIALGVITILFFIFKSVPGDEAAMVAGARPTQAEIEAMRVRLGLDRPLVEQYLGHMLGLAARRFRLLVDVSRQSAAADARAHPGDARC